MPPASNDYRDLESGRPDRSSHVRFYQQPPSIISHPDNNSLPTSSDLSSRTTQDDRSAQSNGSRGSSVLRKQMLRLFRKSRSTGDSSEQERILQQGHNLKSAGTFDTTCSSHVDYDGPYEHPKSQSRMTKKWGKLKEQMATQAPEMWMRSMDIAQRMANGNNSNDDPLNREELVKQAQDTIRNLMEFSLWQCLLAMLVYVSVSVYCFSYWLEDWTIVDSVYFAVVTFTTIGYGDVVPDTLKARIFTCFWALSGVACLGIALGVLGSQLIEVAEKEQKKAHDQHRTEVISMFNDESSQQGRRNYYGRDDASTLGSHGVEDYYDEDYAQEEQRGCCSSCTCSPKAKRFFLLFTFLVMTLFGISMTEDWDVWSTVYYGLITASTVGYGDLSPTTENGRILATLYIPIAVGVMGTLLDFVANAIIENRRQKAQQYLKSKELTLQDLAVMDGDGDGTVTRAEFLEFMLVAMNQVDQELLDNLHEHFDRLDKDHSGSLDKADLINIAQKKLDSERKLSV